MVLGTVDIQKPYSSLPSVKYNNNDDDNNNTRISLKISYLLSGLSEKQISTDDLLLTGLFQKERMCTENVKRLPKKKKVAVTNYTSNTSIPVY